MYNTRTDAPIWDMYNKDVVLCDSYNNPQLPFPLPEPREIINARENWNENNWEQEIDILDEWLNTSKYSQTRDILTNKIQPISDTTPVNVWAYDIDHRDAPDGEEISVANIYNGPIKNFQTEHFTNFDTFSEYFLIQNESNTDLFMRRRDVLLKSRVRRCMQILNGYGVLVLYDLMDFRNSSFAESQIYVIVNPANPDSDDLFTAIQRTIIGAGASMGSTIEETGKYSHYYGITYVFYLLLRVLMPNVPHVGATRRKNPLYIALEDIKIRGTRPFSI